MHSLAGLPGVIDIRNYGLTAGIEYEPTAGKPGARGLDTFLRAFEAGILVRAVGDITALSPPLTIEKPQIDELVGAASTQTRDISIAHMDAPSEFAAAITKKTSR